jgi:DNA phosphorothioation-associated putative methyltransferase
MTRFTEFTEIVSSCQNSPIGKLLPNALYLHNSALNSLAPLLQDYESQARKLLNNLEGFTLVKFAIDRPKISYLFYPDFDSDPHPKLHKSIIVDLVSQQIQQRYYQDSDNPPVLHRKETFVTEDYPLYQEFAALTNLEVALGLLANSRQIGTWQEWQQRLWQQGIDFEGHRLVCPLDFLGGNKKTVAIERHKAALIRKELSRPVCLALEAGLFNEESSFFDYGCGYGSDLKFISDRLRCAYGDRDYFCSGWDPYYYPDNPCTEADIVNLGYVINVIEDMAERRQALIEAWQLTNRVLIVAAQVLIDDRTRGLVAYGDGVITSRNTFQKYYQQEELKAYIDRVLNVDAVAVGLGIYFVFRDEGEAEAFRASRFHSRVSTPRVQAKVRNFADYQKLLTPLMEFYTQHGRLPVKGELAEEEAIKAEFHHYRSAFKLISKATDEQEWQAITEKRRQDLLVYLALTKFGDRPSAQKLSAPVKEDFKALFGSYKQACVLADKLLFSISNLKKIGYLCQQSSIGKKLKNALVIHISALETLDPLLRVYEGCASCTLGRLENANLIKLYFHKPKISYLFYHDFDTIAHPLLHTIMDVDIRNLSVSYQEYYLPDNPPVLHQKDLLVADDYPLYHEFAKLTHQEDNLGLFKNLSAISRFQGWLQCLKKHNLIIKGHQLYRISKIDDIGEAQNNK